MRGILFGLFSKIVMLFVGSGLSKVPFMMKAYGFFYRLLLPSESIDLIRVQGHEMYVDRGDMGDVTKALISRGVYHKQMTEVFEGIVKERMTVLDVGAMIGYFTLIASDLVGAGGKVFAFEPEPHNFDLLLKNVSQCHNVFPAQKAVSNKNGKAQLFVDRISFGSHSLRQGEGVRSFGRDVIEVETQTLDDLFQDDKIDVVKIDAEGAEMLVLDGMKNILDKNKDLIIIAELLPAGLTQLGSSAEEFLNTLVNLGFGLSDIDEEQGVVCLVDVPFLLEMYKNGSHTNILAVRR